jgi:hypothetical protein
MAEIIRRYGLQHDVALEALKRTIGCERGRAERRRLDDGQQRLRRRGPRAWPTTAST